MRVGVILFSFLISLNVFAAQYHSDQYPFKSEENATRFVKFLNETRCVVCQNQNLMDSEAPLANDIRDKIYFLIQKNESDAAIINYLKTRYGEFIFLRPAVNTHTFVLWLLPILGILSAIFTLICVYKK